MKKRMAHKGLLNKEESVLLTELLAQSSGLFVEPGVEHSVFAYAWTRTLLYNKIEEDLYASWITKGCRSLTEFLPTGYSEALVYRALITLGERYVLTTMAYKILPKSLSVRIELPGIAQLFLDMLRHRAAPDGPFYFQAAILETIVTKAEKHWNKMKWPINKIRLTRDTVIRLNSINWQDTMVKPTSELDCLDA